MPAQNVNWSGDTRNPFNYIKVEQTNRDVSTAWLTLEQITQHLNLFDDESQDSYLSMLELATRFAIEDYLGLTIFATSYRCYYGSMYETPTALDLPEVSQNGVTISAVSYWNDSTPSVLTAISSSTYYYDPTGNKVILSSLPNSMNSSMTAPIVVDYITAADVLQTYPVIKQAGLLLLTHLYNQRSNSTDAALKDIPFGVSTLLRPYKPLVM